MGPWIPKLGARLYIIALNTYDENVSRPLHNALSVVVTFALGLDISDNEFLANPFAYIVYYYNLKLMQILNMNNKVVCCLFQIEECVVCSDKKASIMFKPCGHMCACDGR